MNWLRHLTDMEWVDWSNYIRSIPQPSDEIKMLAAVCAIDGVRRVLMFRVDALPTKRFCGYCGTKL